MMSRSAALRTLKVATVLSTSSVAGCTDTLEQLDQRLADLYQPNSQ
jgi:hypothetical protein